MKKLIVVLTLLALLLLCAGCQKHTHTFGEWTVVTAATCTTDGEQKRSCECGETETEVLAAGHVPGDPATCTAAQICTVCNAELAASFGHDFVDYECKRCDETQYSKGLVFELNQDGESYAVKGMGDCTDTQIIVPRTHDGKPVTAIAGGAFWCQNTLQSVVILDSVTSVGNMAFADCEALTSVSLPSGLESISDCVFFGCTKLLTVNIPDSVTTIGSEAFNGCSRLRSITLPDGVTGIGAKAFAGCSGIGSIAIPEGVTCISDGVFNNCSSLATVTLGSAVTDIGEFAFSGCHRLVSIMLPESVSRIDPYAFYGCSSLTSLMIPKGVASIGYSAFASCNAFATVYYGGTAEQWTAVQIGMDNNRLNYATRCYYSETAPSEAGNYWHWVDGVPTKW